MVIVCTGTYHRLRSVEIYVGLSFQCSKATSGITTLAPQGWRGPSVPPLVSPSGGAHLGVQVPVGPALPHLGGS